MLGERAKIRLYVDAPLGVAQSVPVGESQANYLFNVMRLNPGDRVALFNGRAGEWTAEVVEKGRRRGRLSCVAQALAQQDVPDLWLLFAPVKKARTDFIVEKATEMGVRRILPVQTRFTNSERVRRDRLQARAVEAAEQCGATRVPEVGELVRLDRLLQAWDGNRRLMFCDEGRAGGAGNHLPKGEPGAPWAVLIGPEGGFSPEESTLLGGLPFVSPVSLGPRILRADTAAVAALTLWQATLGDWR